MHFKPQKPMATRQAACLSGGGGGGDDDGDGSRSGKSVSFANSPRSYSSNTNNNNNNNDNDSTTNSTSNPDDSQIQLKRQTLEQRKQELEKLLDEKSWLLQQLQKQEAQILNGNYEYLNLNEIFSTLQQCRQGASIGSESAVLMRKAATGAPKENNNNNYDSNRHSEISSRSSEYDNCPGELHVAPTTMAQQLPTGAGILKAAPKSRPTISTSNNWHSPNTLSQIQQQQQQQILHQYIAQMTEEEHFQYTQQQVLQHQHQQRHLLEHQHCHPRQQLITAYQSPTLPTQATDAISLHSTNTANDAAYRQPLPLHLVDQLNTPMVVQCDKYYLSPTHHSYNDGGFIRSSRNIKQYISPQASPTAAASVPQQIMKHVQLQHQAPHVVSSRSFDTISPSLSCAATKEPLSSGSNTSVDVHTNANSNHNLRWRSQSNMQHDLATSNCGTSESRTYSTDRLINLNTPPVVANFYGAAADVSMMSRPVDEISVSSFNSETQKKPKTKQWLESTLDGPAIRTNNVSHTTLSQKQLPLHSTQHKPQMHNLQRERPRLSSQSMSSGAQRYNVIQRDKATRMLQDDDGKYAKLSQSTSYLNSMEVLSVNTYFPNAMAEASSPLPPKETAFHYVLPKIATRPLPLPETTERPAISPEIRIESPKNMTVVQQATFQPYKEVTKPFEMSDFYKYSTKFKQREGATPAPSAGGKMESQGKS